VAVHLLSELARSMIPGVTATYTSAWVWRGCPGIHDSGNAARQGGRRLLE
jgi:hypothetical protein